MPWETERVKRAEVWSLFLYLKSEVAEMRTLKAWTLKAWTLKMQTLKMQMNSIAQADGVVLELAERSFILGHSSRQLPLARAAVNNRVLAMVQEWLE